MTGAAAGLSTPSEGADVRVKLVSATKQTEGLFWAATYLGRSLDRIPDMYRPDLAIRFSNTGPDVEGLSGIYNAAIDEARADECLLFVHDDVYLHDWFISQRVQEGLERFDIVGVAGSINPDLSQPSWGLKFTSTLAPDGWQEDLDRAGAVNHFDYVHPRPSLYGPTPMACSLLDGVLLAARGEKLKSTGVRFDEQFAFHFYDLDFCRVALQRGLRLGTWPISITHNSGGAFDTEEFRRHARAYIAKWAHETQP